MAILDGSIMKDPVTSTLSSSCLLSLIGLRDPTFTKVMRITLMEGQWHCEEAQCELSSTD